MTEFDRTNRGSIWRNDKKSKDTEPARSASIPTIGPARRRVNIPAASTIPISCGLKALVSKNLGQNGDATPKAAYKAA